jgi:hypothetical protein
MQEIPAEAMQYIKTVSKSIVKVAKEMVCLAFRGKYNVIVLAVEKDKSGGEHYVMMSDIDDQAEMNRIMLEAVRRSSSGVMLTNHDDEQPKH